MIAKDMDLLKALWHRLVGGNFSSERLIGRIRHDGGNDVSNLSDDEVLQLIEGRFSGNWREPVFSFAELLGYYAVNSNDLSNEQIVGWVFTVLILVEAMERGDADIDLLFNSFIDGFSRFRHKLPQEVWLYIFARFFACSEIFHKEARRKSSTELRATLRCATESLEYLVGIDPQRYARIDELIKELTGRTLTDIIGESDSSRGKEKE